MNKELLQIISMTFGGLLFSLGGYRWKWLRRFCLPFVLAAVAYISNFPLHKVVLLMIGLMFAFSLGYGERKPYSIKMLVGICFILPTLLLGYTIWQLITPILWIIMFRLSNWRPLANQFYWKMCEFMTGALIGVTIGALI